jgi:hypothetical protein
MTKVFIAGSLSRLNADVKRRIDTMIEKGFTILLSFLKVRWRARSVSLSARVRGYRKESPMPPIPEPPEPYRGPATFSRFIGKR